MTAEPETPSQSSAALDPVSRISEILFGLIMVLTFTGSLSVATAGREDIREMLHGALGCNLVWGLIDALLFLLTTRTERGRSVFLLDRLHATSDPAAGRSIVLNALPERIGPLIKTAHLEDLRKAILAADRSTVTARLTAADWRAAAVIFALVFLSVFPVAIPFLIMQEPRTALRVSNGIAIAMLFGAGCTLARYTGGKPAIWGSVISVTGIIVVFLTIALGG